MDEVKKKEEQAAGKSVEDVIDPESKGEINERIKHFNIAVQEAMDKYGFVGAGVVTFLFKSKDGGRMIGAQAFGVNDKMMRYMGDNNVVKDMAEVADSLYKDAMEKQKKDAQEDAQKELKKK